MKSELVQLSLIGGSNDPDSPDQHNRRQELQQTLQPLLTQYVSDCWSNSPNPTASATVFSEALKGWLQLGKGRKVLLTSGVSGGGKAKEAQSITEIDELMDQVKRPF
jgi:hypothetical protein